MEIILIEDVDNLGSEGDIVEVADGYARNYLIPRQMAVRATEGRKKQIKQQLKKKHKKEKKNVKEAEKIAEKLEDKKFTFPVKAGEQGRLFGSVTTMDIEEKVNEAGFDIDKKDIELDDNIKELGIHKVPVKIYKDVSADLKIEVVEAEEE
ncbi:MAG: 50S ribosomal protein L9 [Bacillota bacterium]